MLDLKIESFLKVVELKSYTSAAEVLHLTQPAITQHVQKLADYYGCKLIDSSKHSVQLTAAGEMLYQHLCLQRANERQFFAKLKNHSQPLKVGATLSIADYYLPEALIPCICSGQESCSVFVENTEQLIGRLQQGTLDCAFVEGNYDGELFESLVFCYARFLPIAASTHPLAGKTISLEQLYQYPLALRESGSGTRELLTAYLSQYNASPRSFKGITEMGSFALLKALVYGSDAVTFAYEGVAKQEVEQGLLTFLKLNDYSFIHPLHFIYRKNSFQKETYEAFFHAVKQNSSVLSP